MGMTETLKLLITGDGRQLRTSLRGSSSDIRRFTRNNIGVFRQFHRTINSGLKRIVLNPLTGLAGGAGLLMAGKQIIDFDAKLKRVGIQGRMTNAEIMRMRESIIQTAIATGQSREEVLAGIDAIVERTGDITFADKIKKEMAIASTATGAAVEDMGALAANLNQKFGILDTQMMDAFNTLTVQGKAGAFTLQNMAAMGERLFSAASNLGMKGVDDLKKFGALIQVARIGTGSSEMATTAVERILGNIIAKQDVIAKKGFDIFTNKDLQQYKSIDEIIKGTIVAVKGNQKELQKIFGEEGIRGVSALARMYRETGGFDLYDKLVGTDAQRAGELMEDFARYSEESSFQLKRATEIVKMLADIALSKQIYEMTDALNSMLKDPVKLEEFKKTFEAIGEAATVVAKGMILSAKGYKEIFGIINRGANEYGRRKTIDVQWDVIPKDERKLLRKEFGIGKATGRDDYYQAKTAAVEKYLNNINLSVHIDDRGRVSTRTNDMNTRINARANIGKHTARQ